MKPGVQTTEFWGTGAFIGTATTLLQAGSISEVTWGISCSLSLVAFIISRWLIKTNGAANG